LLDKNDPTRYGGQRRERTPFATIRARVLWLLSGALAACAAHLSPAAATTTSADAQAGWLRVRMPSMGVAFAVPARQPDDVHEFADEATFHRFMGTTPERYSRGWDYKRFVAVRSGDVTYSLYVMVGSDDLLRMLIQTTLRAVVKSHTKRARIELSGYAGIEAWKHGKRPLAIRSWTAGPRFYMASVLAKDEAAFSTEEARRFLESIEMLDRP
jgi:hypothetical protein